MTRRAVLLAIVSCGILAPAARGADPIMPLSEVRAGMSCTGLSVVRGTEISSFDVEVIDVIADDTALGGARILIRVSGPAVDATGVGPGFSGSPVICGGRNAGAISEGIGEYGNKVVLATPIEAILTARPVAAPRGARRAPRLLRSARPLAGPLTVSGLSVSARRLLDRAARRAGRTVLSAPPGPQGGYPVQDLQPGAVVAASISTGDISLGAVGTVAYRDGDQVFGFGHLLDGLGERALFMQDAYVFGVIGNPVGVPDFGAQTYKLTSSGGHVLGSITNDTFSAIYGTTGAPPPAIALRASARVRGGAEVRSSSLLADERRLGYGAGMSFLAPLAAQTALDRALGSLAPVTLRVCARFRVRQRRRPIGFCNPYFDPSGAFGDVAEAAALVESFDLAPLDIRSASVNVAARRGVVDAVLVGAEAPRRVRAGQSLRVRLALRRRGGGASRLTVRVPVPRGLRPGPRTLVIAGNGFLADENLILLELIEELARGTRASAARLAGTPGGGSASEAGHADRTARAAQSEPSSVRELAGQVAALRRPLGITARFRRREPRLVLRSNDVRYDGKLKLRLRVLRARR